MQLGVVVTDRRYISHATGILEAATRRGWNCRCFLTDTGVHALEHDVFRKLLESVNVAVCELSVERYLTELDHKDATANVVVGGQYQDAELVHNCDQILVF